MSDLTQNISPIDKQVFQTIHKMISELYDDLVAAYMIFNPFDKLQKLKSLEHTRQLNRVRRLFVVSITECLSTFIFCRAFNNELLYIKSIDPLKSPAHFVDVFSMIMTNIENFKGMIDQFVDSDYRDKILNDEEWINTDETGAKGAKYFFEKNDIIKSLIMNFKDDFSELSKKYGSKGF